MKKLADNILSWCNNPEEGAIKHFKTPLVSWECVFNAGYSKIV